MMISISFKLFLFEMVSDVFHSRSILDESPSRERLEDRRTCGRVSKKKVPAIKKR